MKQLGVALIILAASAGSSLAAESPFAGNWKLNLDKSKFTGDTFTYSKTAKGYHYSNGSTVAYDFAIDGKDYPTVGNRTVSWTKTGDDTYDSEMKAKGAVLAKVHRVLSPDGKTMTVSATQYRPDGTTPEETDVYDRVSGTKGLAGKWRDVKTEGGADSMTISVPSPGKFEIQDPSFKETEAGSTNGAPTAVKSPTATPGLMVAYKASGPAKWDHSTSLKGKVYMKGTMTVSADGKTLTDTTWVPGKETEKSVAVFDKE